MFVELLCLVYRKKSEAKTANILDGETKIKAELAFQILLSWKYTLQGKTGIPSIHENPGPYPFPGWQDDNGINEQVLQKWIKEARKIAEQEDRIGVCDSEIGHIIAYAAYDPEDNAWPHKAVRNVIESNYSKDLASGIITEQFNKRGVTTRGIYEGGVQELDLAKSVREWAKLTKTSWPKTSDILKTIGNMWENESKRSDVEVEVRKLGDL